MAGFSLPWAVYTSEKATTSAPLENILTPNGVPPALTVRRIAATVRTVLTGMTSNSVSVTFWLLSAGMPPASAAVPCGCRADKNGSEAMRSSPPPAR